jgi:hypothetical protein
VGNLMTHDSDDRDDTDSKNVDSDCTRADKVTTR